MSYAIIRNEKYKRENLKGIYRHNERRNKNYSNKNINKDLSYLNYSLKKCKHSYEKEFDLIKEKYNLKGQIKTVSNIACEYIITSDKEFFDNIGTEETKRYFKTAYDFVCEYKDLSDKYVLSAKVHMDEETPHMHLVFIPVVHTKDKRGTDIDKIACSEFWKEKDSYRLLQDAFYSYIVSNGFNLQRGNESSRTHLSVEEYKRITNFENTKVTLKDIDLKLPDVPNIKDINKLMIGRDDKIEELIIKPKDELIQKLYDDNSTLYHELNKQSMLIDKAQQYEKERKEIISNNKVLNLKVQNIENDYSTKLKEETKKIELEYKRKVNKLEDEVSYLNKIINTLKNTIDKFISWVCDKFKIPSKTTFINDFEQENNTYIDAEKQINFENEQDMEM